MAAARKIILSQRIISAGKPLALFSDDFDWKDEFGFWKVFGEDFSGYKDEFDFDKIFGEDFSEWE